MITPQQNTELKRLYGDGLNDYEVAAILHIGRNSLRMWRNQNGIRSKSNKKGLSGNLCQEITTKLSAGGTLESISQSMGVHRTSVSKLLKRNGINIGNRLRPRPTWTSDYKLTEIQASFLMGDMFGDGGLVKGGPNVAYYQCGHSIKQKDFVDWKYEILSPLSCRKNGYEKSITMATWSSEIFYDYWRWFYPSGRGDKVLLPEMVDKLNWFGIAVWFMGDGTRDRNSVRFSVGKDQNLVPVVNSLNNKFGDIFEAKLYEREWFLKIRDNRAFFKEVTPYLLPYFYYKIPDLI